MLEMAISKEELVEILKNQQELFQEQQKAFLDAARADSTQREEALLKRLEDLQKKQDDDDEPASDLILSALSKRIPDFSYDPDNGLTFDVWFQRFEDVMSQEGSKLNPAAQARFLVTKLDSPSYSRLVDKILPKKPAELSIKEATEVLNKLFGQKLTTFRKRYDCFKMVKSSAQDYATFSTLVNRKCETARINKMTDDDFKCLVFVSGLQAPEDAEVRTRLLRKLEQTDNVTLDDLVTECDMFLSLKKDAKMIEQAQVQMVKKQHPKQKYQKGGQKKDKSQVKKNAIECFTCGGDHFARDCTSDAKNAGKTKGKPHQKNDAKSSDKKVVNAITGPYQEGRKYSDIVVNGKFIRMQIDSGADITLITKESWKKLGKPRLEFDFGDVVCALGGQFKILGRFETDFSCKGYPGRGFCYVEDGEEHQVLGIEWIDQLKPFRDVFRQFCCMAVKSYTPEKVAEHLQHNFPEVFQQGLGCCSKMKAKLVLKPGAVPIFRKKRPVPFAAIPKVDEELDRLIEEGVISPVDHSEWAAPVVVVQKPNGKIRLCADFSTGLNDQIESHQHPLPTTEEIFSKLNGGVWFAQIDLADAYNQIEMDDESKCLLTINTHRGLFRFNRLAFGVKSAPGIFQQIIDAMIADLPDVSAFLDDVIAKAKTAEELLRLLEKLFERLRNYGLRIREEKCHFMMSKIKYLGFVIDKNGRRPDPSRIEAIEKMPPPQDLTQVRAFLGLINYYGAFVPEFRKIRAPLDALLKKDAKFIWSPRCQDAFNEAKRILTSDLLLTHFDPALDIVVSADASEYGIGAVIMHKYPDGSKKAVAHASRALTPAERNYGQIEKEALALTFAVRKFHRYIHGRKFVLQTDHKPLLTIFGSKKGIPVYSANRLQRWGLVLMGYDFNIEYQKTTEFGQADGLSRLLEKKNIQTDDVVIAQIELEIQAEMGNVIHHLPVTAEEISRLTEEDWVLPNILKCVTSGVWPDGRPGSALATFRNRRESLSVVQCCLFVGHRIVVPRVLQKRVLAMLHEGHPGATRMKMLARSFVFWCNLENDIADLVGNCSKCQLAAKNPIKSELCSWPKPTRPWERIHMDFAGPTYGKMFLIVVDAYSKWPEVIEMSSTTSEATIQQLRRLFAQFGIPETIVSDNGTQFTSAVFLEFCKKNNIQHIRSPPFHPQSNGQAERFVDTFKRALKKMKGEGTTSEILQTFLFTYRKTPCPSSPNHRSPAENFIGRPLRSTLTRLNTFGAKEEGMKDKKMEQQFKNQFGAKKRSFEVGNLVYARDFRSGAAPWTPGKVTTRIGRTIYEVEVDGGVWKRHANQLRQRMQPEEEGKELFEMFELPSQPVDVEQATEEPGPRPEALPEAEEEERGPPPMEEEAEEREPPPTEAEAEEASDAESAAHGDADPEPEAPAVVIQPEPVVVSSRPKRTPCPTQRFVIDPQKKSYISILEGGVGSVRDHH